MPTITQTTPQYRSDIYYDVVIGSGNYLGWKCFYAGDGCIAFRHASGDETKFEGGAGIGWMKRCWDAFTEFVATQSMEPAGNKL